MRRNSNTIAALTFCLVTAASHRLDLTHKAQYGIAQSDKFVTKKGILF